MNIFKQLNKLSITGLQNDSRNIKTGEAFLAYPGEAMDGRQFIENAIQAGAAAIVYEPEGFKKPMDTRVPFIAYPGLAKKLGRVAAEFYAVPEGKLNITGITGTNGKTTIAYQLAQAHDLLNNATAYMGTLGAGPLDTIKPLNNTTPDALCVQKFLHQLVEEEIGQVSMEVSSHGLCEGRVSEVPFTQAIYTNLSHEHLDYHKTFEAYAEAKSRLFAYPSLKSVILNQDDGQVELMRQNVPIDAHIITYGLDNPCDVSADNIQLRMTGSLFDVKTPEGGFKCSIQLLGRFNVYNSLAVIASLIADGYALSDISAVMPKLSASPGRMEQVASSPVVLVDYAHTPDALEKALETLKELEHNKLIAVFGCGGDRDKAKRPLMAKVAEKYADTVILTNDNPRTENPYQILKEIAEGFETEIETLKIEDRREAIQKALELAGDKDIILIAGKGHETYQEIGHERFAFSDARVVRELMES